MDAIAQGLNSPCGLRWGFENTVLAGEALAASLLQSQGLIRLPRLDKARLEPVVRLVALR